MCVYCLDYAVVISDDDHDDVEDDIAGDADNNLQEIQRLLCEILQSLVQIYNILQNMQQMLVHSHHSRPINPIFLKLSYIILYFDYLSYKSYIMTV